jgi:hypothetical protein
MLNSLISCYCKSKTGFIQKKRFKYFTFNTLSANVWRNIVKKKTFCENKQMDYLRISKNYIRIPSYYIKIRIKMQHNTLIMTKNNVY